MVRWFAFSMLLGALLLSAQETTDAGPKVDTVLPGPFDCYNLNGKFKGRQHDLVTEFGLRPVVTIFAREVADGKEGALGELLKKLDEAIDKHTEPELRGCIIYVSPFARSSATDSAVEDPVKLVEEAKGREALLKRLAATAEKLKNVIVGAYYPATGPQNYGLNARDVVTLLFYDRLKVVESASYGEGQLAEAQVEAFMRKVHERLAPAKK
jgi:hypothetical protein